MITPPELCCISFLTNATKAVQEKYPNASLMQASAQKEPIKKRPMNWGYDLFFSVTFRVEDTKQVVVTNNGYEFQISQPENVMVGLPDIGDVSKIQYEPWNFTSDYKDMNDDYTSIRLARLAINPSVEPQKPDQAYYTFFNEEEEQFRGWFGAMDGKAYQE